MTGTDPAARADAPTDAARFAAAEDTRRAADADRPASAPQAASDAAHSATAAGDDRSPADTTSAPISIATAPGPAVTSAVPIAVDIAASPAGTSEVPIAVDIAAGPANTRAVLADLVARYAAIASDRHGPQPDKWEAMLIDTLASPALAAPQARAAFEAQVAATLAAGWQPGHDALFWVAPHIFGWDADPALLRRFGHDGDRLTLALDEQRTFDRQVDRLRFVQRYIAARLRRADLPSDDELLYRVPHAVDMARRFPIWCALTTDIAALDRWTARYRTLPKARKLPAPGDTRPWSPDVESNRALVWIVVGTVALMAVISVISRMGEPRGPRPQPQMTFTNTEPVPVTPASNGAGDRKD